ncbi:hypothetical protein [Azorhizobium sp. AG788]|uniref:hypothetical protein n=1 Tax=Azorhizobium sp. AG788 TaxID=2183897 RepID=UPI003139925F
MSRETQEREAFEKWASGEGFIITKGADGDYLFPATRMLLKGWFARASVYAPSVGVKETPCDSQSREALRAVVAAWENTKSGQTNRAEIQRWLIEDMKPAIDAARSVLAAEPSHADDLAVDRFAVAMKAKLAKKRAEGRGGWDDKGACSNSALTRLLRNHVEKGDPIDVGNLAMMIHQRGERVAALTPSPKGGADGDEARQLAEVVLSMQFASAPGQHARSLARHVLGLRDPHGASDEVVAITTNGTTRFVPKGEPVFLVRGQDAAGAATVRAWSDMAEAGGAAPDIIEKARSQADLMEAWPVKKNADLPAGWQSQRPPVQAPKGVDAVEVREDAAKLIESMIWEHPYAGHPTSRMALAIAAKDVRRGRKLTPSEQLVNLAKAMQEANEEGGTPDTSKMED